jgi:hypothetical protein
MERKGKERRYATKEEEVRRHRQHQSTSESKQRILVGIGAVANPNTNTNIAVLNHHTTTSTSTSTILKPVGRLEDMNWTGAALVLLMLWKRRQSGLYILSQ